MKSFFIHLLIKLLALLGYDLALQNIELFKQVNILENEKTSLLHEITCIKSELINLAIKLARRMSNDSKPRSHTTISLPSSNSRRDA